MITISKNDYLRITQGRILKFYNPKSGSFMEVRRATKIKEEAADNFRDCMQQKSYSLDVGNQQSKKKEVQDYAEPIETQCEAHSCVTDDDNDVHGDECTSQVEKFPFFRFSAKPKVTTSRKRYKSRTTTHDSSSSPTKE
ncbi:Enolase [Bienertia sinuspersici]